MKLEPGDIVEGRDGTRREITEVRPTGYTWRYPDLPAAGDWWSENSTDPMFDSGWRKVADLGTKLGTKPRTAKDSRGAL